MKSILTAMLIVITANCFAQVNTFFVSPIQTDINYTTEQDSHLVVRNPTVNINKLFLFLGGTGASTESYNRISKFAGGLGYDVLNIAYLNDVPAVSLTGATDSLAFDKYRQEICFGTPLSPVVTVDSLNSIVSRAINLLTYLNATFPAQNWDQYLVGPNTLDWSKIAIGGHSQGAGHACYLAKFVTADRVLMFSGPNDYSNHFAQPANWLSTSGITPIDQHFVYLSLLDEVVDFSNQLSNLDKLGLYPLYDTTHTDVSVLPFNDSHCLYTTQTPGIAIFHHNATVKFSALNNSVWGYMLTSDIVSSIDDTIEQKELLLYPNPTHSSVTIYSNESLFNKNYLVQNLNGQIILTGKLMTTELATINLSTLENGIYFVTIDKQTFKIIKQ